MLKQIYLGEVLQEMELKIWTDNSSYPWFSVLTK